MGKLGAAIAVAATAKIPFTLTVGKQRFDMLYDFNLPSGILFESFAYAQRYLEAKKTEAEVAGKPIPVEAEGEILGAARIRYYAASGFRDADGECVWDDPEVIPESVIMPIQIFIMENVLGTRSEVTDDDVKK